MKDKIICAVCGKNIKEIGNGLSETYYKNANIKLSIAEKASELIANGVTDFLINAEYGFPLWAAEVLIGLREIRLQKGLTEIRVHIFMPWEEQASDWSDDVHERFYSVHERADEVWVMQTQYTEKCYENSERFMIDNSHMLFTDDDTYFAAQYATLHGKPVHVCKPFACI